MQSRLGVCKRRTIVNSTAARVVKRRTQSRQPRRGSLIAPFLGSTCRASRSGAEEPAKFQAVPFPEHDIEQTKAAKFLVCSAHACARPSRPESAVGRKCDLRD